MKTTKSSKKKEAPIQQEADLYFFKKQIQLDEQWQKKLAKKPAEQRMPCVEKVMLFIIHAIGNV